MLKNIKVIIRLRVLDAIKQHSQADSPLETGGVMIGLCAESPNLLSVVVTSIIHGKYTIKTRTSLTFTPETWASVWGILDANVFYSSNDPVWSITGWYHSHPTYGVFLSSFDIFIHRYFFSHPGGLALVIDPETEEWGIFGHGDDSIVDESENLKFIRRIPQENIEVLTDTEIIHRLQEMKINIPAQPIPAQELI